MAEAIPFEVLDGCINPDFKLRPGVYLTNGSYIEINNDNTPPQDNILGANVPSRITRFRTNGLMLKICEHQRLNASGTGIEVYSVTGHVRKDDTVLKRFYGDTAEEIKAKFVAWLKRELDRKVV